MTTSSIASRTATLPTWLLQDDGPERLGLAAGLTRVQGRTAVQASLPWLLAALMDHGQTPDGEARLLEAVRVIPRFSTVAAALDAGEGAADLQRAGQRMAPALLGPELEELAMELAERMGTRTSRVKALLYSLLPLILGRLGSLGSSGLQTVGQNLERSQQALPPAEVLPPPSPVPELSPLERPVQRPRRGLPWWLLIMPLLLLSGLWLSLRLSPTVLQHSAASQPAPAPLAVAEPAAGTRVSASGFTVSGSGPAGETFTIMRGTQTLSLFTVKPDGTWQTQLVDTAANPGPLNYLVKNASGQTVTELPLQLAPAALSIRDPLPGSKVSGGGFNITGVGSPGLQYQVFENGISVGNFTVDPQGRWSVDIPAAAPGQHFYDILDSLGNRLTSLAVLAEAPKPQPKCREELTLSLQDDEKVNVPFRFGGQGRAERYEVTVWREDRQIGLKYVERRPDCTWSYTSRPGVERGQVTLIRYEVRPLYDDGMIGTQVKKVTLQVLGKERHFDESGRYQPGPVQQVQTPPVQISPTPASDQEPPSEQGQGQEP